MTRRSSCSLSLLFAALLLAASFCSAQESLQALTGNEVGVTIDMPGSQTGADLRFNKKPPMDWKDYGKRIKDFGIALHKGDTARITAIVQKNDRIEVQLNGGGFGTFGDNTQTTVDPKITEKSDYEKQLERDIANTTDDDKRRDLQRDLDRERARRQRQDDANRRDAQIASLARQDQVANDRAGGGSRFNLRWSGAVPQDQLTPDAILHLLSDYMTLAGAPGTTQASGGPSPDPAAADTGSPAAQLKRGMTMAEVAALLGPNRQISSATTPDGLKTQVEEYTTTSNRIQVTFVDSIVVRYTISSL